MIVIVTLISTTLLFVIALATRFRRKRPFTAETVIQDGLASFGVGIAFGLVAYPTLSVVTAFVRNGSTFTPQMLSGFDPNSLLISLVIGAFATTVLAVFEYIKRVWRQEEQAEESIRTQDVLEPSADTAVAVDEN